jgi:hypothetical protein
MLQDQPATKELFRPFEMSIAKTLMYLRRVKKHAAVKNIDFSMYPLGTGIVKALPIFQIGKHKEMPPILDETTIGVDIESLLCDWQRKLKEAKRRGRARPRRRDKDDIVLYAAQFFCRHSARKPSNDVKNPFPTFVEQFYEAVSGAPSSRSLNSQIGKVLKALRTAGIMGLFETPPPRSINSQQFTRALKELSESGRRSGV